MRNNKILSVGKKKLEYDLQFSQRKTLSITVDPNKKIIVRAPLEAEFKEVEKRVRKKVGWIVKQLNYFEQFQPLTPPRKFLNGETHLYLGRQYRLKIRKSLRPEVILKNGYINVCLNHIHEPQQVKKVLDSWYQERAEIIFHKIYDEVSQRIKKKKLHPSAYIIRNMKKRWGSCTLSKMIIINRELIKAPKGCIEYVIVHEMCHLKYPNHSKAFYSLQSSLLPDWEYWKNKLEVIMS